MLHKNKHHHDENDAFDVDDQYNDDDVSLRLSLEYLRRFSIVVIGAMILTGFHKEFHSFPIYS